MKAVSSRENSLHLSPVVERRPPALDEAAFEAIGGRVAALDQRGTVMLGDIPMGQGRIVVIGGLLPQPTENYFHPYGLANYSVTHVGYQVLLNALGAHLEISGWVGMDQPLRELAFGIGPISKSTINGA